MTTPSKFNLPLLSCRKIAKNTYEARLSLSSEKFNFEPGQYVTVTLPGLEDLPVREQFRDFSISSANSQPDFISFTFRGSDSIFKQLLLKLKPGTELFVEGPAGVFTMPPDKNVVFVAGGVGITPFYSIAESIKDPRTKKIPLVYYNDEKESATYRTELAANPNLDVYFMYKKPESEDFLNYVKTECLFMIAGPPAMVASVKSILTKLGVKGDRIKAEEFSGYER